MIIPPEWMQGERPRRCRPAKAAPNAKGRAKKKKAKAKRKGSAKARKRNR